MNLRELWKKYDSYDQFNISVLPEEIRAQGVRLFYPTGSVIISLGDSPDYVYFIESGVAIGTRDYNDGNNYFYFRITNENGSVGLLEVLAQGAVRGYRCGGDRSFGSADQLRRYL